MQQETDVVNKKKRTRINILFGRKKKREKSPFLSNVLRSKRLFF